MSAIFPSAIATSLQMLLAINNTKVTLNVAAGIGDTTLTVDDPSALSTSGYLTFDDNEASPETVSYTGKSGTDLTGVTRAADGTSAGTHSVGAHLEMRWNAAYHNTLATEIIAVEQNLSDRIGVDSGSHVLKVVAGAVGAPSLEFSGDTNTGLYSVGADILGIATGGVLAVTVNASQQVTIPKTTNQIILGTTNTITINGAAPSASRTYTIPDAGGAANFALANSLTATTVPYLDSNKLLTSSAVTPTELGYVSGVTSALQTQLGLKAPLANPTFTGTVTVPNGASGTAAVNFNQLQNDSLNILDNGGFEIWQRGVTFTAPATLAYTSDRWQVSTDEATNVTITKETTTIDSVGLASMKVVATSTGASHFYRVRQLVENYADYRGKTLTLSVRVKTSVASAIKVALGDDSAIQARSSYHTGGGGWETLSVSYAFGAAIGQVTIFVGMIDSGDKKDGTYYFDSAMLTLGSEAVAFVPTNPQVDLARCMRFAQLIGGTVGYIATGQNGSTTTSVIPYVYPVPMRTAPSFTVSNATNFQVTNVSGSVVSCTAVAQGSTATATSVAILATVASGLLTGGCALFYGSNANASILLSADL